MKLSIRWKLMIFIAGLNLLVSGLLAYTIFNVSYNLFFNSFLKNKFTFAQTIAKSIDGDQHKCFDSLCDIKKNEYKRLQSFFHEIKKTDDAITYLYTINYNPNTDKFYYCIDADIAEQNIFWIQSEDFALEIHYDSLNIPYILYDQVKYRENLLVEYGTTKLEVSIKEKDSKHEIFLNNQKFAELYSTKPFLMKVDTLILDSINRNYESTLKINNSSLDLYSSITLKGETYAAPGELMKETPENIAHYKEILKSGNDYIDSTFMESTFGKCISAYGIIRDSKQTPIGIVCVDIYENELIKFKKSISRVSAIIASVSVLIILIILPFLLEFFVVRNIKKLDWGIDKIAEKELDTHITINSKDEFENVANGFNSMAKSLKSFYENLEEKVRDRTATIEQQKEVLHNQTENLREINNVLNDKNETLNQQKEEITTQRDELEEQSRFLMKQGDKIFEQKTKIKEQSDLVMAKNDELRKIEQIVQAVNSQIHFEKVLEVFLQNISSFTDTDQGIALILDKNTELFKHRASFGLDLVIIKNIELNLNAIQKRYLENATLIFEDIYYSNNVKCGITNTPLDLIEDPKSMVAIVVRVNTKIEGLLVISHTEKDDGFDQKDLSLINNLKNHIYSAFIKAQILESLQNTLDNLKATQEELIRKEKLASIGQLTKGIVDRVINPLNYINNFSGVTLELVQEIKQTIENETNISEDGKLDIEDITIMMQDNLSKVLEHGQSATKIIKGMEKLLKEKSTILVRSNINSALKNSVDSTYAEYIKIEHDFKIEIDFNFANNLEPINILPYEFSQAVKYIVNNSLYALKQKSEKQKTGFTPKLKITTELVEDKISIQIYDNGKGMPAKEMLQLFSPFFTTKPTAKGIGLGLYMTREIIKEHKGVIYTNSIENEFTEVVILLPK